MITLNIEIERTVTQNYKVDIDIDELIEAMGGIEKIQNTNTSEIQDSIYDHYEETIRDIHYETSYTENDMYVSDMYFANTETSEVYSIDDFIKILIAGDILNKNGNRTFKPQDKETLQMFDDEGKVIIR